jgi:TolB-like protein
MKKTLTAGFVLLLGLNSVVYAQNSVNLDTALQESVDYLTGMIPRGSKIVVLNFQSDFPDATDYIITELMTYIINKGGFTVVDRQNLELLRREMDFQLSGEVSDESVQAIGRKLGAQTVVSGTFMPFGDLHRLHIRAIEVETAAIQGMLNKTINSDRILTLLTADKRRGAQKPASPNAETGHFSLSAGGGLLLGGEFFKNVLTYSDGLSSTSTLGTFNIGIFGFFDATYVEAYISLYTGARKNNNGSTGSRGMLKLGILGKYPFVIQTVRVFPLLGIQYGAWLASEWEGNKATGDLSSNNSLWISPGGGIDFLVSPKVFIRGEILWGFKLDTEWDRNYRKQIKDSGNKLTMTTHGPAINIALGYTF